MTLSKVLHVFEFMLQCKEGSVIAICARVIGKTEGTHGRCLAQKMLKMKCSHCGTGVKDLVLLRHWLGFALLPGSVHMPL